MPGRIPQTFIDEIVTRSDVVEIIGSRITLKKAGREFKACCPFHSEKTPSFWVSPEKQFYHCFGCGAHGTVVGFLMQYEKLEFPEAIAALAERAGLELPREAQDTQRSGSVDLYDVMSSATRFFEQNLKDHERAREYLAHRGIDVATAQTFALGYATDSWNALLNRFGAHDEERRRLLQAGLIIERDSKGAERQAGFYDRFRDRLMFPIRDGRGRVLAFGGRIIDAGEPKYLNSPETPLFHKGRELYGLYEARQARADFKRLLIVEGYMDVVRLHQAGITFAVATLGTATTQEHLNKIFRITSEVVFCFDGDRAGRQAAWRALENALPLARDGRELKFMFLPEGQDPDTLIAADGREKFEARLLTAMPMSEYLLSHLSQQADLAHVDGRAKLAALARPLFLRMPEGIYRELLADRLAAEIRMPAAKLKELLLAGAPRPVSQDPAPRMRRASMSVGRGNLLTQAIGLVLHYPSAARAVVRPEQLDAVDTPGAPVLRELLAQARDTATPSTAVILERWRERPEFSRLTDLAGETPLVADAKAAVSELQMAIEKIAEAHGPGQRVNELLRKAQEQSLNFDEKTELSNLLRAKGRPAKPA